MGNNPARFQGENLPVENIWEESQSFCKKTGLTLPTEAQWEYACRGESPDPYYCGNNTKTLRDYAWFKVNAQNKSHPIAGKIPNAYGIYDMHGNVEEFCKDYYNPKYYRESKTPDPKGPSKGAYRVVRGGSWFSYPPDLRSSARSRAFPRGKSILVGFRVAYSMD